MTNDSRLLHPSARRCDHGLDNLSESERAAAHWQEDDYGVEVRINCGCSCSECQEY